MKFLRYVAVLALAVTAFGAVAPGAGAKSILCPDCYIEGAVQGSGIMPDISKLNFSLNVVLYATDPLVLPEIHTISFVGDIVDGDPNVGSFQATGTLTSDIPTGNSVSTFASDAASVSTYTGPSDFPYVVANPISINAEDVSGLKLFVTLQPKVQTGLSAVNLWSIGHPFVGSMYMLSA